MSSGGQLQQSALAELRWEPRVTAAHIGVTANNGIVTLSGHVGTFVEKHAAEVATWITGVRAVAGDIEVKLSFDRTRGDIAAAALERLAWDPWVPLNTVTATVENGRITLAGTVGWRYQSDAAEQDVCRLHGVIGLINHIALKPTVSEADTSKAIEHTMHRAWLSHDQVIRVNADGGQVRLTGTVHTPHDRLVAEDIAWAAPGTIYLENDIVIV